MDHPSHPHPLHLKPPGAPYTCNGCKELGFGPSYSCENRNCSYTLHEECAIPVFPHAFHRFFEKSCFVFYEKSPGYRTRYCDACGNDVLGFVYHCSRTGFDLHPCCLKLKDCIFSDDDDDELGGGHVKLKLSNKVPSKCVKCKHRNVVMNKVKGWSYVSNEGDNNFCYHVSCFKDLILENWRRGYFSTHQETNSSNRGYSQSQQLAVTSMENMEVVTRRRSRRFRTISKMVVVVFKLIFSAIFGNPVSAIAALLEALASD